MLDTQRLTLEKFLLGYKHGVYIFTSDACSICTDYKAQLEWVKSPYLYFVEVVTDQEKAIVRKVIDRIGFPATVAYLDNPNRSKQMNDEANYSVTDLTQIFDILNSDISFTYNKI